MSEENDELSFNNNGDDTSKNNSTNGNRNFVEGLDNIKRDLMESKNTNYVVVFGKASAGKTALIGAMLHYLTRDNPSGTIDEKENNFYDISEEYSKDYNELTTNLDERLRKSEATFKEINENLKAKIYPSRTKIGQIHEQDVKFIPNRNGLSPLKITFLDMQGEYWKKLAKGDTKNLSTEELNIMKDIEILLENVNHFRTQRPRITFLLVVPHFQAGQNDDLTADFITYLMKITKNYQNAGIFLVLSQWDKKENKKEMDVNAFIKREMPATHKKMKDLKKPFYPFSLGDEAGKINGQPSFRDFDMKSSQRLWEALYYVFTGKHLRSWWSRFFSKI